MYWSDKESERVQDAGDVACTEHSRWLTQALASGREYPRIPRRLVALGGFSRVLARPNGAQLAERWWMAALGRMDR